MMPRRWTSPPPKELRDAVVEAIGDLETIRQELDASEERQGTSARLLRAEYWGTLAATRKRLAEVEFLIGNGDWRHTLQRALGDYSEGLKQGIAVDHWILGQYVVLQAVLSGITPSGDRNQRLWDDAERAVVSGLESLDPQDKMWAYSSMADLRMVELVAGKTSRAGGDTPSVVDELKRMVEVVGGPTDCPALWPTFRQFWRFAYWWRNERWDQAARDGYQYLWHLVKPRLTEIESVAQAKRATATLVRPTNLGDVTADPDTVFVLMPFSEDLEPVFEVVRQAADAVGLRSSRADSLFAAGPIIDQIVESIAKSGLVVAELTGRNQNVMYELGLAHSMGKETLMLAQGIEDVPFDVRSQRVLTYDLSPKSIRELRARLIEAFRHYRGKAEA
jgi:hypothetical protein